MTNTHSPAEIEAVLDQVDAAPVDVVLIAGTTELARIIKDARPGRDVRTDPAGAIGANPRGIVAWVASPGYPIPDRYTVA